ncbi:MAG: methyl-accepting chemotaxis protein [Sulfuricurvum sp.]|jgi:methyl-accepting chemotaxis protein
MFSNLSLKQKILGGGLLPLVLVGLVNIIGLINFNGVVDSYTHVSHTYQVIEMGNDVEKAALNMEAGERGYLLTGNLTYLEPYVEGSQAYPVLIKDLKQMTRNKESLEALIEAEKSLNAWESIHDQYIQKRKALNNSPRINDIMSALVGQRKGKPYFDAFRVQMKVFETKEKALLDVRAKDSDAVIHTTNNVIIIGTLLALILAVISVIFMLKTIISPISSIKEAIFALNSATNEILATTAQVSSGASQTFSAVSQTSASIEQIKQTAKVSSGKATQTAESTSKAMEIAKSGTDELNENMRGLNQIKEKMDLIASNIIQLSEQSQQIGEIITTVEDIANQSNMLAVNASIEAVKAGEQGKGFSVVAQELKNLAEQSKSGTKQVQKILFDIQKVTGTLVMVAEQGGKAVESGVKQAQNAKISMDQLNSSVYNAANASKQIAASYDQELAGMDQISGAMGSIKEATSQNLSSIKQVEMSARDLSALSQKLKEVISDYIIAEAK